MKILSILSSAEIDDAGRAVESAFGRLSEGGHEIHAVLPRNGPLATSLEARGIRIHLHPRLPVFDGTRRSLLQRLRRAMEVPASVLWVFRLSFRLKVQVVHTNSAATPTGSLAAWLYRKPHLWHIRELFARVDWRARLYQQWIHAFSFTIIAVSTSARDQFEKKLRTKIKVIYDGIDLVAGQPDARAVRALRAEYSKEACLVGVAGPIEWQRTGQEVLVRAASTLREKYPAARYLLGCNPTAEGAEDESRLREVIATYGLGEIVQVLNTLQTDRTVQSMLDVAVAPPIRPVAFDRSVIEAMAAGRPVVGSRTGGIAEEILDGITGLLFPAGDSDRLANDLDLLLSDPALRQRMGEAGRQRVRSKFSIEETCHLLDILFETAAKAHAE